MPVMNQIQVCVHHWRIDEPNGQVSMGTCKVCGVQKTFKNWNADTDFITNEEHRAMKGTNI